MAVVAAVTTVAVNAIGAHRRRRAAARVAGPGDVPGAAQLGPAELERRALEAERAGDLDGAVRLRFAAGLLRLDAIHAIDLRPSLTSGAVGRILRSERYDELARPTTRSPTAVVTRPTWMRRWRASSGRFSSVRRGRR